MCVIPQLTTGSAVAWLVQVACEAEVTECEALPDGRFYVEIVGRRRFAPVETREQDGYRVAVPHFITDAPPAQGSEEERALQVRRFVWLRIQSIIPRRLCLQCTCCDICVLRT